MKKLLIITLLFFFIACGNSNIGRDKKLDIFDERYDSTLLSKQSFQDIGFKFSKEYDVSELPDAESAYYGFWGEASFERLSFELRFYPSNERAKFSGTFYAEEVTGEDAILKKADASWKEGIKDRSMTQFHSRLMPRYLDFVILGNVVVLCPSEKSNAVTGVWDPIENCRKLLSQLHEVSK
jgi:hypothetical protein